jgi:DNA-directed RNA polymerase subunit beta
VKGGRVIDYVQIVNSGDSEFKAGEIVEKEKVEDANEELKRRAPGLSPHCFYLSAWEEDRYVVAQANASLDEKAENHHGTGQLPPGRQLRAEEPRGS